MLSQLVSGIVTRCLVYVYNAKLCNFIGYKGSDRQSVKRQNFSHVSPRLCDSVTYRDCICIVRARARTQSESEVQRTAETGVND